MKKSSVRGAYICKHKPPETKNYYKTIVWLILTMVLRFELYEKNGYVLNEF